jgi:hypothetical protein
MKTELWILKGESPGHWEIPVRAMTAPGERRRIAPACPLFEHQRQAFDVYLETAGVKSGPDWLVPWLWLKAYGKIATKDFMPEALLVWHGPAKAKVKHVREARQGEFEPDPIDLKEFIDAAAAAMPGLARAQVETMWHVFCAVAMKWLLQRRFVDMGFIRLHVSPFRVDWKELAAARSLKDGKAFRSLDLTTLQRDGFRARSIFRWSIDVEFRFKWWARMKCHELERLDSVGQNEYYRQFMQFVVQRVALSEALHKGWRDEVCRPATGATPGDASGGVRLKASRRVVTRYKDAAAYRPANAEAVAGVSARLGETPALAGENGEVPPVSDLQPNAEDLRHARPDVSAGGAS